MKKIVLLATLAATLSGLSAFGQGSFIFGTAASYVWDNYTTSSGIKDALPKVTFLWGSGTPLVDSAPGPDHVATNNAPSSVSGTAWTSITSDPSFHFATNNTSGLLVVGTTGAAGTVVYNGGSTFFVTGTSASGGSTTVFMVAWDGNYADPFAAAAANAAVGWSRPFTYVYAPTAGTPQNFSANANTAGVDAKFGVSPIPEPSTFALAGLGAAALLIFRRRK